MNLFYTPQISSWYFVPKKLEVGIDRGLISDSIRKSRSSDVKRGDEYNPSNPAICIFVQPWTETVKTCRVFQAYALVDNLFVI